MPGPIPPVEDSTDDLFDGEDEYRPPSPIDQKLERQLALLLLLSNSRRPLTQQEIRASILDYQRDAEPDSVARAFERDKDDLRSLGFALESRPNAYDEDAYQLASTSFLLPDVTFDESERLALAVAARSWQADTAQHWALAGLRKLETRDTLVTDISAVGPAVVSTEDPQLIAALSTACANQQAVTFTYRKLGAAKAEKRSVQPWCVLASGGHWYLVGFDTQRGADRSFRLARFVGPTKTSRAHSFDRPSQETIDQAVNAALDRAETQTSELLVKLLPERANSLRILGKPSATDPDTVSIATNDPSRVVSAVLASGPDAIALSPDWFVDEVTTSLSATAATASATVELKELKQLTRDHKKQETTEVRLQRLLALIPWLQAHPEATLEEAAENFHVSVAAIHRDLEIASCTEFKQGNYYTLDILVDGDRVVARPSEHLDGPVRLTVTEAITLMIGLRLIAQSPTGRDLGSVASALQKLEDLVGVQAADASHHIVMDNPTQSDPAIAQAVQSAIDNNHALAIEYLSASRDAIDARVVDPISQFVRDGHSYLHAWCRRATELRIFRIDRIQRATELSEPSTPDLTSTATGTSFNIDSGQTVTLVVEPQASWWAEAQLDVRRVDRADGSLLMSCTVADQQWLLRQLLSLGGAVHVVSPSELADDLAQIATTALHAYNA